MASGYSRARIFSPNGIEIAELNVSTVRSWVLDDIGRCQFLVPIYDAVGGGINPMCRQHILEFGNLILIEHRPSVNVDGTFNGVLPPWVGVILPPRAWQYGQVQVTAYSAEQVLFFRPTPAPYTISGMPGSLFSQLIVWGNDPSYDPYAYPIQLGQIDYGGGGPGVQVLGTASGIHSTTRTMNASVYEEIKAMIVDNGGDWNITPQVDANNRLTLVANYYASLGTDVGRVFSNVDVEAASPIFLEQNFFYNWVRGYSSATAEGNRNFATAINYESISRNGLLGKNNVYASIDGHTSAVGFEAVSQANQSFFAQQGRPFQTVAPEVLDVGNDFSYLRVGNIWNVELDTVGFTNGQLGLKGKVRITAMEYDDLKNSVRIAAVLL